jgi:hypothetical protein
LRDGALEHPSQQHDRFVIDFDDLDEEHARQWPALLCILEERVKPFRSTQKNRELREVWWQFARRRPALRAASKRKPRLIMRAKISTHHVFGFVPGDVFVSAPHVVIVREQNSMFAVLQSTVHEVWVATFGAALEDRICYTPSLESSEFSSSSWFARTHFPLSADRLLATVP